MPDPIKTVLGWLGGLLFAITALGAAAIYMYNWGKSVEHDVWVAKMAKADRDASEDARRVEKERFRTKEILDENHRVDLERARRTASAARTELDRLRLVLAERERIATSDATTSGRPDGAATERKLLDECAGAYQKLAETTDQFAGQVRGLQSYVLMVVKP